MAEIPSFQRRRIDPVLRPDQLQFVAFALDDLAPRLGADAHPVDRGMRGQRAVGLDRDLEAARVERRDQRVIDLEHRLAPGEHDETMRVRRAPETLDGGDEAGRLGELAPARAVGADEIGVAEAADRGRAVLLAPCPRSEEHTSELQSLMRISYAVFCLKKNNYNNIRYYYLFI